MKTASCETIWKTIIEASKHLSPELAKKLQDDFCDFECAWKEHAEEYHDDPKNGEDMITQ
jgi:hypothetical protein